MSTHKLETALAEMFSTLKLSRRHFEFIADEIAPLLEFPTSIETLADKLEDTNPRFDHEKFTQRALRNWEDANIPYATVSAKDKDTGFITENQCKSDDDVASYVCDNDYEIIKIEYHQEAAQ